MMIKTLIFDFGGVLINLDKQRCVDAFVQLGLTNIASLIDNYAQSGIFAQLENGDISADCFRNEVRKIIGRPVPDHDIDAAIGAFLLDVPRQKLELLLQLRKHYRVLLLSNTNAIHFPWCERTFFSYDGHQLSDFFDRCYLSYEINRSKPSPEIFNFLLQQEQIAPCECLFLDDGERNIATAKSLGFNTILVPERADLRALLQNVVDLH